jgi:hypothetical protein
MQDQQKKEYAPGYEEDIVAYALLAAGEPVLAEKSRLYFDTLLKNEGQQFTSLHVVMMDAVTSAARGN